MKLKYLINLFLILIPLVLSSGCDDLDKDLLNFIKKCTTNDKGIVTELDISWYYNTKTNFDSSFIEQFDKLTDLKLSCSDHVDSGWDSDSEEFFCIVNADLSKLKNLKSINKMQITEELMDRIVSLPKLQELTLKDNFMGVIPEYVYSFKNLEYLDLSINSLITVDEKLNNLENLKHLDLSGNELINIPKQIINLKKLEYLNLSDNHIVDVSPEYLNDFENLKYFYIQGNKELIGKVITNENLIECSYNSIYDDINMYNLCIPKGVKEIKCLKSESKFETCIDDDIAVSSNGLCGKDHGRCPYGQCCSKDGKCTTSGEYCLISKNCQIKYGSCINECQEINEYLTNNKMNNIRCMINSEGRAIEIDLLNENYFDNYEKVFQNFINQLPNLHSLEKLEISIYEMADLSVLKKIEKLNDLTINGDISYIPKDVLSLTNLKKLIFNYNISKIPPKIGELKNLKELLECISEKMKMPVELGNLTNLEILNLSYCENVVNYSDFIGKLVNLKSLCFIYDVPKEIGNLSKLEDLDLSINKISTLPKEFGNLTNLKKL
ncbi:carbohydrate-binding module family 18 protein [Piromyces sp. E2]|nr:carbohydrate-binding module family 18 protein [Piromyces sp. E2]|eukprot:OUM70117.1 carbohydrate-binding module family 18 protein [Piromyces sp. E2]